MRLFNQRGAAAQLSERQKLEKRYASASTNILLTVILTAINIVLLAVGSDTYFLFSATIPYFLAAIGILFTRDLPADVMVGDGQLAATLVLVITLVLAVLVLALYLISWLFAKKQKVGWMKFALVFFCIDTVALLVLGGISLDSLLDIAFHIGIIVSFAMGISAFSKLKNLPPEEDAEPVMTAPVEPWDRPEE